jgi:hypothetical protein
MRFVVVSIAVVAVLARADHAEAQQGGSSRPYRGLFASGVGDSEQLLTATASIGGGWDDNLVADAIGQTNARVSDVNSQFRGGLGTASGALSYSFSREPATVEASAGTTAGYYPRLSNRFIRRHYGSLRALARFENGLSTQAAAMYQPYSLRSLLPGLVEPSLGDPAIADEDFPALTQHYVAYSTGAGFNRAGFSVQGMATYQPYSLRAMSPWLFQARRGDSEMADQDATAFRNHLAYSADATYTRRISLRQSLTGSYNYRTRESLLGTGRFDHQSAGVAFTHVIGKGLDLRLGYRYSEASYGVDGRDFVNHTIDAGVNYNRALSISRRTILSFATGSAATRASRNESLRYRATGAAQLAHEIGRTWSATLSYNRGLEFTDTWPEPLFSDTAAAGLSGLITRRSQFQFTARASRRIGQNRGDRPDIAGYSGAIALTFAVNRHINTGLTYTYYKHQFASALPIVPGLPRDLERQSIRGFVSVWLPVFHRARRP